MIRAKRIQSDIKELKSAQLPNIHYSELDEEHGAALIYGPPETPYEFFPLLFHISFPPTYPFKPPTMRLCGNGRYRIHPLLEIGQPVEIKGWSASFRLSSALMAIYGLLQTDPLRLDCAYSIVDASMNTNYNEFITYNGGLFAEKCLQGAGPKIIAAPFIDIIRKKYEEWTPHQLSSQKKWNHLPYAMVCDKRP